MEILPALAAASGYGDPNSSYNQDCKDIAVQIGLPRVDYPFFISMDNATVHLHGRALMMEPRHPTPSQLMYIRETIARHILKSNKNPAVLQQMHQIALRHFPDLSIGPQIWFHPAVADDLLQLHYQLCEQDLTLERPYCYHHHRFVLHAQHYMPLSGKSPDLHSPVEHMVQILKCSIRHWIRESETHSSHMYYARSWKHDLQSVVAD